MSAGEKKMADKAAPAGDGEWNMRKQQKFAAPTEFSQSAQHHCGDTLGLHSLLISQVKWRAKRDEAGSFLAPDSC